MTAPGEATDFQQLRQLGYWDLTHEPIPEATARIDIENVITTTILNHPRSLQKRIGPSEIGTPCDHCLAAKLAGWEQHEQGIPWTTTKGTAIHAWLERAFINAETPKKGPSRWATEATVQVGTIGGQTITGSTDLLDLWVPMTVDWKFVGTTSLRKYKANGPSQTYLVQANLYAKGWNDIGIPVNTVSICFLPAQSAKFEDHHWWVDQYRPDIAQEALARADHLARQIQALQPFGQDAVNQYITGLPRDPACYDCKRYPDWQPDGWEGDAAFNL